MITPVDFDHEAFLGTQPRSHRRRKGRHPQARVPAVFARQRAEAGAVLDRRAAELGIPVTRTGDWQIAGSGARRRAAAASIFSASANWTWSARWPGEHQVENAATAAVALRAWASPPPRSRPGIARTRWPGRLERISEHPEIILDGAHNPAGARALAAYIERFYAGRRVALIYGAMRDKAVDEIAGILFPLAREVIVTAPLQARALSPESMPPLADHPVCAPRRISPPRSRWRRESRPDAIFITGSLFLVAEARAAMIGAKS